MPIRHEARLPTSMRQTSSSSKICRGRGGKGLPNCLFQASEEPRTFWLCNEGCEIVRLEGVLKNVLKDEDCLRVSLYDACINYEKALYFIPALYLEMERFKDHSITRVWRAYLATLTIMLFNGLRASETIESARIFYELGERDFYIKAKKGGSLRRVIIPGFIKREDLQHVYIKTLNDGVRQTRKALELWVLKHFNATLHGFRYAFIRYHSERGLDKETIGRALGLRDYDNVTRYYLRPYKPSEILGEVEGGEA